MSLESKIRAILSESAYPGKGKNKEEAPASQGSSVHPGHESMGVKGAADEPKPAAAPAPHVAGGDSAPPKQGDSKDAPHEDLGTVEAGKKASGKSSKQPVPAGKGAGPAKDFVDAGNQPIDHINKSSSAGNRLREDADVEGFNVDKLFEGDTSLTEEFKTKAKSLFESLVAARVSVLREEIETEAAAEAATLVGTIREEMVAALDKYLTVTTEEWLKENELAVTTGIRAELTENFIAGLKGLFESHYIEVPDEKADVVGQMAESISDLEAKLVESADATAALEAQITELKKAQVLATMTEGLAQTEVERLKKLVEEVSFESEDLYASKLTVIKETYFPKAPVAASVITEEAVQSPDKKDVSPAIQSYVDVLSRAKR
jgi:AcrR family transcriptional regulator